MLNSSLNSSIVQLNLRRLTIWLIFFFFTIFFSHYHSHFSLGRCLALTLIFFISIFYPLLLSTTRNPLYYPHIYTSIYMYRADLYFPKKKPRLDQPNDGKENDLFSRISLYHLIRNWDIINSWWDSTSFS